MATELGTAYVSIVAETSKLEAGIVAALQGGGKQADLVGKDIGKRISASAAKAMKDGWRPDQDIMAGIPDTKLDRIGARIGQVIGKGMVANMRAREAGAQFANSFGEGAGSIGIGKVISGWRKELSGGGASHAMGFLAGKTMSIGLTAGLAAGAAGVGLAFAGITSALTAGFGRLEKIDAATVKLNQMNKIAGDLGKPLVDVKKTITSVTDLFTGTRFSLDEAFSTATNAIGSGVTDINKYLTTVADAAEYGGTSLSDMGDVFQKVVNKGYVTGELLSQLDTRLPATSWVQEAVGATGKDFDKMVADGNISLDMLQNAFEAHASGFARAGANTLSGAVEQMHTAIARVGADFLSAIFGGPSGDPTQGIKDAINRITGYLNQLDDWINAHRDDIRTFFDAAKDAAGELFKVLGNVSKILTEHPGLIKAVFIAFAAFETLKFVSLIASLGTISGLLATMAANPVTLAILAIAGAGAAGGLAFEKTMNDLGGDDTPAGRNAKNQLFSPGFGIPGAVNAFAVDSPSIFGGPGAQRERRGADAIDPTGLLSQTLPQNITPTVDTGPALSALGALRDGQKEPIVIPADSDTAPASGTTGAWRTDEAGNPVVIPVDADTSSASASMAAFIDKWSSAIISPQVVVPGQVTTGSTGKPLTLPDLLGIPRKAMGGGISGPGSGTSDSIPALLSNGEHVLTAKDVAKMGGQSGVYRFRKMLHKFDGGGSVDNFIGPGSEGGDIPPRAGDLEASIAEHNYERMWPYFYFQSIERGANMKNDGPLNHAEYGLNSDFANISSTKAMYLLSLKSQQALQYYTKHGLPIGFSGGYQHYASGGAVGDSVLKDMRTKGAIPAAAGSTAKAGTSGVASMIGMGGEIINGIIDQAASAVSSAASAAAMAGSMGAAGPEGGQAAGAAAQFAIGLASNTAKRGVKYGFDLLGIGADSLLQQLTPFGQPRWLNQDYTGFMPKEQITGALGNLMTGGANQAAGTVDPNTTEHGAAAGAQPGAAPGPLESLGQSIFDGFSKALPSGAIEPVAPTPMVGDANSFLSTELAAPSSPPPPGQQPIFKVDNIYTQDVDSLGRELNKQGRLAQMQYTNRPGP